MKRVAVSVALVVLSLSACGVQPWVKPYQRDKLIDPVMAPLQRPLEARQRQRIHATHEGAHGIGDYDLTGSSAGDP